ncbi:ComF family protein, partial [Streptomyces scabiei]
GHDPARRIALAAAGELRRTGSPARVAGVLRQRRAVADQAGLDARRRLENLAGALEVAAGGTPLLDGGAIVLVDDLMTTGASLAEAARAVRTARAGHAARTGESVARGKSEAAVRTRGVTGTTRGNGVEDRISAAVVAAPPDSFEINRN